MKVNQAIINARSRANLTQYELASKLGCSDAYVNQIERGRKRPSANIVARIKNSLPLSQTELQSLESVNDRSSLSKVRKIRRVSRSVRDTRARSLETQMGEIEAVAKVDPDYLAACVDLINVFRDDDLRPAIQTLLNHLTQK